MKEEQIMNLMNREQIDIDEAFKKERELSKKAYDYATSKLAHVISNSEYQSPITEEEANQFIAEMEKLCESVKPENKTRAEYELSEATMDIMYAANMTEDSSLRIGRMR
jgi:cobalamin biosynthesis Co2+ chelatase CbiK